MDTLLLASALVSSASLLAWAWLVGARGVFWRTDQRLSLRPPEKDRLPATEVPGFDTSAEAQEPVPGECFDWPAVSVVVPARNEADVLPRTLPTLLRQDYPGAFHVFLVDDHSEDGTAEVARQTAATTGAAERLTVISAQPLAQGWTGKLWALQQGVHASEITGSEFLLLTDADIAHSPDSLRALALKARTGRLDLVSLMARLRVETLWERLLIPAFVYFFAKLYPSRWASDPRKSTAAAGGCILVSRDALEHAGGLEPIAGALIDDCAPAGRIKRHGGPAGGRIWLGLTQMVRSLRDYKSLAPIWNMVARTAFAQLNFSLLLLLGTVAGMLFVYLVPPLSALGGLAALFLSQEAVAMWLAATGLAAWTLMAVSYTPMLRWHNTSRLFAPLLPVTATLYTLMTVESALRWWRGKGGAWKGRTYDLAGQAQAGRK